MSLVADLLAADVLIAQVVFTILSIPAIHRHLVPLNVTQAATPSVSLAKQSAPTNHSANIPTLLHTVEIHESPTSLSVEDSTTADIIKDLPSPIKFVEVITSSSDLLDDPPSPTNSLEDGSLSGVLGSNSSRTDFAEGTAPPESETDSEELLDSWYIDENDLSPTESDGISTSSDTLPYVQSPISHSSAAESESRPTLPRVTTSNPRDGQHIQKTTTMSSWGLARKLRLVWHWMSTARSPVWFPLEGPDDWPIPEDGALAEPEHEELESEGPEVKESDAEESDAEESDAEESEVEENESENSESEDSESEGDNE
jgi:hypothetical protein